MKSDYDLEKEENGTFHSHSTSKWGSVINHHHWSRYTELLIVVQATIHLFVCTRVVL